MPPSQQVDQHDAGKARGNPQALGYADIRAQQTQCPAVRDEGKWPINVRVSLR